MKITDATIPQQFSVLQTLNTKAVFGWLQNSATCQACRRVQRREGREYPARKLGPPVPLGAESTAPETENHQYISIHKLKILNWFLLSCLIYGVFKYTIFF